MNELSEKDIQRYKRQIILKDFGEKSQKALKNSTATVFGCGGLGCPTATYLAAAGIGKINLIDFQKPELSNLNRQIMHFESDMGKKDKSVSLKEKLERLNSSIEIKSFSVEIDEKTIGKFNDCDILVDCLDNFHTRYLLNKFSLREKIPLVHAAVEAYYGQITTIIPEKTPCIQCLFPNMPSKKEIFPIIGPTCGVVGSIEAMEVIKVLTGIGDILQGKLLIVDLKFMEFETINFKRKEDCSVCSKYF
ncbi:MAG: HesA/MoeB/ThiF family protein [Candidatus Methanofastidiosum sp.]|nr:HesA/MoeB/ThiF family protein [Methanofastidiosum sp.]